MPEIRIDRTSSGRRLLVILSKEREKIDIAERKLLKIVAINTAITNCIFTGSKAAVRLRKNWFEKVCVIAVDNL